MARKLFPSQEENEQIFLVIREHWVHLLLKVIVWLFFAGLLIYAENFAKTNLPGIFVGIPGEFTVLVIQLYDLLLTLSIFLIFVFYYLNIQVITNIRVVDISQEGLFDHTVSELHIDKIEDATSQITGWLGTIFNYGDVFVQTAGTHERFDFHNVPNPAGIEKLVLDLYEKNSNFSKEGG